MKNIQENKQLFQNLFNEILSNPGQLADYYSYFHAYSFGNMALLKSQGVNSPVATFKQWGKVNRRVNKGAEAKYILVRVSFKSYRDTPDSEEMEEFTNTRFFLKKCIFELNDTNGDEFYTPEVLFPEFDKAKLLTGLGISEILFSKQKSLNSQGYANPNRNEIAINPIAKYPIKTILHEIAHCLLHKRNEGSLTIHGIEIPRDLREVEAESTAYLVGCFLDLFDEQCKYYSRGYIQNWILTSEIPERSVQRIFGAVDKIIKALSNTAETNQVAA